MSGDGPISRKWDGSENLSPIQPGQVLNPEGKNQYSYRKTFEEQIGRILAEERGEDSPVTNSEAIGRKAVELAIAGDKLALKEVLERVWVAVKKIEASGPDGGPIQKSDTTLLDSLSDEDKATMLKIVQKSLMGGGDGA